jgi:hypothetical protein
MGPGGRRSDRSVFDQSLAEKSRFMPQVSYIRRRGNQCYRSQDDTRQVGCLWTSHRACRQTKGFIGIVRSIKNGAEHGMEPVRVTLSSSSATRTLHGRPTASVAAVRPVVQVPRAAPQRSHKLAAIPQRMLTAAARSRPPGCAHWSGRREADGVQHAPTPGYHGDPRRDRREMWSPWRRHLPPWQRLRRP